MPKNDKANPMEILLLDPGQPMDRRVELLRMIALDPNPHNNTLLASMLARLDGKSADKIHEQKAKELTEVLRALEEGPQRNAIFIEMLDVPGSVRRATVILDDGTQTYSVVPDDALAGSLRRGDPVVLDGKARAVLRRASMRLKIGEVCPLERVIDEWHVEATVRGGEKRVLLAAEQLMEDIRAKRVEPGAMLVVNERQFVARAALAAQNRFAHFRFLDDSPPPDVRVERDLGCPPKVVAELEELIRLEMTQPDLRRRYRLPRCVSRLLAGVTGAGKSFAIDAIWRKMYEVMSEVTGVPIEQLPPRVIRISPSEVLSKWFGESDQNISRAFKEAIQIATEPWRGPDGREHILPVLFITEEIDGLARARGQDAVYDRVMTTLLQRLDPGRPDLAARFIIFIGTTNVASQVDAAFLRRIGSKVELFGRLKQRAFKDVLTKRLHGLPVASRDGTPAEQLERRLINDLTAWLYSPNSTERGVLELIFTGQTTPVVKHRRDFFTPAVVDRAVRQAAEDASRVEASGAQPGLTLEGLMRAFDEQVRSLAEQVTEQTAGNFVDLPDGVRVASVRRVPQPEFLSVELQLP